MMDRRAFVSGVGLAILGLARAGPAQRANALPRTRLPALAQELVKNRPDLIVAIASASAVAAKQAARPRRPFLASSPAPPILWRPMRASSPGRAAAGAGAANAGTLFAMGMLA